MKIKDIFQVVHGKQTTAFHTSLAAAAPDHLCFSIISKAHQSIDLEASELTIAEEFVEAVDYLKDKEARARYKKKYALPAPAFQMPVTQASLSQILNASLLLTNKKVKSPTKKSKSRKSGKVVPTHSSTSSSVPRSTTHVPPTRRLQGYTKKKFTGKKRKTTKGSPLMSSTEQTVVVSPVGIAAGSLVEFDVVG